MIGERLRWLRTRASQLLRRGKREADTEAELRFHLDQLVESYRQQGLSEDDARCAAQREFGPTAVYREEVRDVWRPPALADLARSVRFAVRSLCRSLWFTLTAVLTLALGVGVNTSMFSVLNAVTLKPLPYPSIEHLDQIIRATPGEPRGGFSTADAQALRAEAAPYGQVAAIVHGDVSLADAGRPPTLVAAARVTANVFNVLGLGPDQGRGFLTSEEDAASARVCILSDRVWRQRFGGGAHAIGGTIRIDGAPHEVVGVLPAAFNDWRHLGWVDVFVPLRPGADDTVNPALAEIGLLGRRAPGVSFEEGLAWIARWGERRERRREPTAGAVTWALLPMEQARLGDSGASTVAMLVGLSGFVLLIACSNLANLCLARAISRTREFAVRAALGASRAQLVRPLLVEALILALAGGAFAVLIALWFTDWLQVRSTGDNGEVVPVSVDATVLGWALGVSIATALAFAIAPALFASRLDLTTALKSGGRGHTGAGRQRRVRSLLIVGQFSLALVLLTGAALFVQGLTELNTRRAGWDPEHVLTGTFRLPPARYDTPGKIRALHERLLKEMAALPEVASVSLSHHLPYFAWEGQTPVSPIRQTAGAPAPLMAAEVNRVTPGYFQTVSTPLLAGRTFTREEHADRARDVVINERLAQTLYPEGNALGQRLAIGPPGAPERRVIVGVVHDVQPVLPGRARIPHQVYLPLSEAPTLRYEFALRTSGSAATLLGARVRSLFQRIDPDLPVVNLKPAQERIRRANYQVAVLRDMLTGIAVVGLTLAAVGLYGVVARSTAQRTAEFGIRLALGGSGAGILRMVLAEGVRLVVLGALLGILGAYGLARVLASSFPGMPMHNTAAVLVSIAVLTAVALFACYWPARRAARIDASETLRAE